MYDEDKEFKIPKNVKQIGTIGSGVKVYIEDYGYTYIQQYAETANYDERIGVLVGKTVVENGERFLFISGVIQGKYSKNRNGMEVLTEKSNDYIDAQMKKYFKDMEILGWVYIQPGFGEMPGTLQADYHVENFKKDYQVMFAFDPLEKLNGFFCWNEASNRLEALRGYFIYYDKNAGMHEYMLENRMVKEKLSEFEEKEINASEISPRPRTIRSKSNFIAQQKRLVNLFGILSGVLFLTCFIMGAGLIQNDDRINELESKLAAIDNSYKALLDEMGEKGAQSVFAAQKAKEGESTYTTIAQTTTTTEKTTETTTEETKNTMEAKNKYVVQEGDSLSKISMKFYGSNKKMQEIMDLNGMDNPDKIYFGKVLYLP